MIYHNITEIIGNTPIIYLKDSKESFGVSIFAKLEYLNPFGSLKDRIAWAMIKNELKKIKKNKKEIIENSSGNTAKALAILASIYDIKLNLITNRIKFPEKKNVLKIIGTTIEELPGKSQCLDPKDPYDPQFVIEKKLIREPERYFFTNQYFNPLNKLAHYQTAKEILKDVPMITHLFTGVGTAGSSLGIREYFEKKNKKIKIIGIISEEYQIIPGIRSKKELASVGLFDKKNYDHLITVTNEEAVQGSIELIRKYGIISGPTGGASFVAIKKYFARKKENRAHVVFLACDRFEFYLEYFKKIKPDLFEEKKAESIDNLVIPQSKKKNYQIEPNLFFNQWTNNRENLLIIDIRSNIAFRVERISGSINIPEGYLQEMISNQYLFPKEKTIIFVCPFGENSIKYAYYLSQYLGYQSFSLAGGIVEVKKNQLPLEKGFYGKL